MTGLMIEAALRGLLFAAVVGAGLAALRVNHVPVRKAAWTLVLIASLAMPFLMRAPLLAKVPRGWSWMVPIRVHATSAAPVAERTPVVPAATATESVAVSQTVAHASRLARREPQAEAVDLTPIQIDVPGLPAAAPVSWAQPGPGVAVPQKRLDWPLIKRSMLWIYFAVGGALLLRLMIGLAAAMRLWMTAKEVSPLIAPEPRVRTSASIASPVTIGLGIVLPAGYEQWEPRRLRMVLAHERSHVRQLDFYLQLAAGVYTAVFWFSPLGWWLRRRLSALAESISDRAGMKAAASSSDYAQVVLDFAALPHRGLPGVAMARSCNLARRIEALLNERLFHSAFAEGRRRALASLLLIPVALFAATALIRVPPAMAQSNPPNPANPPAPQAAPANPAPAQVPPTAAAPATGRAFPGQGPDASQVLGPAPTEPALPVAPPIPPAPPGQGVTAVPPGAALAPLPPPPPGAAAPEDGTALVEQQGNTSTTTIHDHDQSSDLDYHESVNGDAWLVASGHWNDASLPASLSASRRAQIEAAHRRANGPFLWFTHGGKSYVVTDPAEVERIVGMYQAMADMGREQRLIGRQQGELGREQGQLAREQYRWDFRMPDMARIQTQIDAAMKQIEAEQKEWSAQATAQMQEEMKDAQVELSPEKQAEIQARIRAAENAWTAQKQAELDARLAEAQKRIEEETQRRVQESQAQWSEQMSRLGEAQGRLGEAQGRLGEAQGRLSESINRRVQEIIQQSLANGKAVPVQ